MQFRDTATRYGIIGKFLHWSIALLVFLQIYLVYWTEWMLPQKSPIANFYINGLHKPIGMVVLGLAIMAILWRISGTRPTFPKLMHSWEKFAAHLVHGLLYLCLIVMPLSGLIMSTAAGYPPNFFGWYQIPMFIPHNKEIASYFFNIHSISGFTLMILVGLHIVAALKHHFINRDGILKRMLPWN